MFGHNIPFLWLILLTLTFWLLKKKQFHKKITTIDDRGRRTPSGTKKVTWPLASPANNTLL
jgi:hypothetical protein